MRLDNETAEYWDSLADSDTRKDYCREIVSHAKVLCSFSYSKFVHSFALLFFLDVPVESI